MNQEQLIDQEQGIELVFWDTHMRSISEGRRLNRGERMPRPEDVECLNGHLWKIVDTQTVVGVSGTPANPPPVAIFFCVRIASVKQSLN